MIRLGAHPQRLADEFADRDAAAALLVGRPGLEPHDVRMVGDEFGAVLDEDQALARIGEGEQRREQRRLAGARSAGDEERDPLLDELAQQADRVLGAGCRWS